MAIVTVLAYARTRANDALAAQSHVMSTLRAIQIQENEMSIAKSNTNDLASLFKEGFFKIPAYQRRYSWGLKQQLDLLNDLNESYQTKSKHFLGTLSVQLIETKGFDSIYNLIDGQQRFTTLILLYSCLANKSRNTTYKDYLKRNNQYFLEPLNRKEKQFLSDLLDSKPSVPKTISQELMLQARDEFNKRIRTFTGNDIDLFIDHVLNNAIFLVYPVEDYTSSIKMFETINDRGMPLGYFDKIKSFFLYYSDKYLNRNIDADIEQTFDKIYDFFDQKQLLLGINNDSTLILYHYLSNPVLFTSWSYTKSTENIFLDFKKEVLKCSQSSPQEGEKYIKDYLSDICTFIDACLDIEHKLLTDLKYKEFFLLLNPNQRMFPLSIRFNQIGILDNTIEQLEKIEFFLKFRRDPKKDIFKILQDSINFKGPTIDLINDINNSLYYIYEWQDNAIDIVNSATWAAKYALYKINKVENDQIITPQDYKELEVEHIFSQEPSFPIENYGYDEESYHHLLNNIGNLTLLEKKINGPSGATNKPPEDKIATDYLNSNIRMTQNIKIKNMNDVKVRSVEIEKFLNDYFKFELL